MVIRFKVYHLLILVVLIVIVAVWMAHPTAGSVQTDIPTTPEPVLVSTPLATPDNVELELEEYYFYWSTPLNYPTGTQ